MNRELRILILEDVATDAELTEYELRRANIPFISKRVDTRETFLKELQDFIPDAILADYSLPQFNAMDALKLLKENKLDIPFVLVTGSQGEEVAVECIKMGMDDYILKSSLKRLNTALLKAIEKRALEKTQRQLLAILGATDDFVGISDVNGNAVYLNKGGRKLLGIGEDEDITDLQMEECHPEWVKKILHREAIPKAKLDGIWKGEISLLNRNGSEIPMSQIIIAHKSSDGTIEFFSTVARDITERKKLEGQLRQSQKMESLGTLAGGIAHDFNNILGIIMGHSSLLKRNKTNSQKLSQSIKTIQKASERGASLIKQLLMFARKTETSFEPVSVNDTIREVANILSETIRKTIAIKSNLKKGIPPIIADPSQIHQILLNLCVNARDAMGEKGTMVISTAKIKGQIVSSIFPKASAKEYVLIRVSDTGTGMDDRVKQRVFEPFFTTKEQGKGTGLGLSLVYSLVANHNGFIGVESEAGKGSTFSIYIPIQEQRIEIDKIRKQAVQDVSGGTETILLIEDEYLLRELVADILTSQGYTVLPAQNGEEGVEIFLSRQKEIDLVVSDLGLPKLGGEEVCKRIRAINPQAEIIIVTGFLDPVIKSELCKLGVKYFIQKPYASNEVLRTIRKAIEAKQCNEK